jgi:hypothetical protein
MKLGSLPLGMHFCNKRGLHPDPELKLYNSPIKIVSETKFLDLLFDSKLTFLSHIKMLKNKSLKALNILHTKFDTSVFKGRLVCFNIQTLNWRRSERSK